VAFLTCTSMYQGLRKVPRDLASLQKDPRDTQKWYQENVPAAESSPPAPFRRTGKAKRSHPGMNAFTACICHAMPCHAMLCCAVPVSVPRSLVKCRTRTVHAPPWVDSRDLPSCHCLASAPIPDEPLARRECVVQRVSSDFLPVQARSSRHQTDGPAMSSPATEHD
jgi:hypothetical protein